MNAHVSEVASNQPPKRHSARCPGCGRFAPTRDLEEMFICGDCACGPPNPDDEENFFLHLKIFKLTPVTMARRMLHLGPYRQVYTARQFAKAILYWSSRRRKRE